MPAQKSRVVYIVLAIFLGYLGIHNFYANRTTPGLIQLIVGGVIGPFTCGITTVLVGIWAIVECFIVTADGHGTPFN